MYSEDNFDGKELREYVWENLPEFLILTKKPTFHRCVLLYRKNGIVALEAEKNSDMLDILTGKDGVTFEARMKKEEKKGFGLRRAIGDSVHLQKAAQASQKMIDYWESAFGRKQSHQHERYARCWRIHLEEISHELGGKNEGE